MNGAEVPYWFWKGLGLMVLWFIGKFIERKYFSEKWAGMERRQTVEIDADLMERYVTAYEKHVDLVNALSSSSRTSLDTLVAFIDDFKRHHDLELKNHNLIKDIREGLRT